MHVGLSFVRVLKLSYSHWKCNVINESAQSVHKQCIALFPFLFIYFSNCITSSSNVVSVWLTGALHRSLFYRPCASKLVLINA